MADLEAMIDDCSRMINKLPSLAEHKALLKQRDELLQEVEHWKGLYEDEKRDHEATIKHCEFQDDWGRAS